jgi:hypothetical protein
VPLLQKPYVFDVRVKATSVTTETGSKVTCRRSS